MLIDEEGYRMNVGIVLINEQGHVFWARRIGHDTWQFPQGGVHPGEDAQDACIRELQEEVGLIASDVEILGQTQEWLSYRLPQQYIRRNTNPKVIGQKQKWFLLQLKSSEQKIRLDLTSSPEFDSWRWVDYWQPIKEVIYFKRQVYRSALTELQTYVRKLPE